MPKSSNDEEGSYLVVASCNWLYWDGSDWVESEREAKKFAPLPDAYDECLAESDRVEAETGVSCFPLYIPAPRPKRNKFRSPPGA